MPRPLVPLLLAAALLAGTAASSAPPDDAEGKRLYRAKCSGCHRLHPREELKPEEWKKRLEEMAKRAKLTPEQLSTIARYLGVPDEPPAASPEPTPAPAHEPSPKTQ